MTATETVSAAVFYRVDGTNFAFGLDWMTAAANKQSIAQAKLAAKRQRATHIAWRLSKAQVGLTRLENDLPESSIFTPWRSAAAAFADLPYSSLLAAFKFRDGKIWILAATNGRIYAKGDRVFTEDEAARLYFDELFAQQYWNDIFAPVDWQSRAKQIDPLAVLRRRRPDGRVAGLIDGIGAALGIVSRPGAPLQAVSPQFQAGSKNRLVVAGLSACLVSGGAIAYAKWHDAHTPRPSQEPPAPYYPSIHSGAKMLAACVDLLPRVSSRYQTPGWALSEAGCSDQKLTVTLVPGPDTPATTMLAFHPEADLHTRKQANIVIPSPVVHEVAPISLPLVTEEGYQNSFTVIDEHANSTNTLSPAVPPVGAPPLSNGRQRPRPYRVSQWSFDTTAPPLLWQPDLAAIPNIEVTSVTLGISDHGLTWRIKGNAYVAP
jgi:hypothetical protein